jgi:hypothetical protein
MINKFLLLALVLTVSTAPAQIIYPDNYFPGIIPKLFAKGILSDNLSNRDFNGNDNIYWVSLIITGKLSA